MGAELNMTDFVTRDELDGRLEPLGEIRDMLRDSIEDLKRGQSRLQNEVENTRREINGRLDGQTERMDVANGRTTKNEESIRRLAAEGCGRRASHEEILNALAAAGVAPTVAEAGPTTPRWKQVKAPVLLGSGAAFGALLPHLLEGVHKVLDWLQAIGARP